MIVEKTMIICGVQQWTNGHKKFCKNWSTALEIEIQDRQQAAKRCKKPTLS
jgi:hypothetical protein